jgi:uncharacterized membrane protein YphA (DoxX/SURF4 family)
MRRDVPMILIRVAIGLVFLTEGILKFRRPAEFGPGRFAAIGFPIPEVLAPLVGVLEIACGISVLLNFFAGDAALLLLVVMIVALVSTKMPILLGAQIGPFALAKLPRYGWSAFLHEARLDLTMTLNLIAILIDSGLRIGRRRPWYQSKGL